MPSLKKRKKGFGFLCPGGKNEGMLLGSSKGPKRSFVNPIKGKKITN
ncbi:MAG: hypothetical protein CM15mP58_05180 [Burkholderiaceae bacterium]|nr:MAG: hypothetical protein CM15mP58_05180 [Burkholderiaceae bacterium]